MNTPIAQNFKTYSDEDVMALFQGGYEEAYNEIVQRYKDRIQNFIFNYTKDQLDSEDITQETFFQVYKSRHSYERIARFSTWLFTIAANLVRSYYRKYSKRNLVSLEGINQQEGRYELPLADEGISQDEQIDNKQFMEIVELSLAEIPVEF